MTSTAENDPCFCIGVAGVRVHNERCPRHAENDARAEGRLEVGRAVREWAMKNEVAEPPLDWAWLGEIIRWSGAGIGADRADTRDIPPEQETSP